MGETDLARHDAGAAWHGRCAMTRALVVSVPHFLFSHTRIQPVALGYLAAHAMAAGHAVELMDLNPHRDPFAALARRLRDEKFDVVGLSFFHQLPALRSPTRVIGAYCRAVREHHAGVLVAGGPTFGLVAERAICNVPELDLGIVGDGESGFTATLGGADPATVPGAVYRDGVGKSVLNARAAFNLDELPPATLPGLNLADYDVIGIQTKRGCAHACGFCPGPFLRGRGPRQRPVGTVLREIESYLERGRRRFLFVDPVFNEPLDDCKTLLREIRDRHWSLAWWALARPEFVDRELVELAEATGCFALEVSADFGTEAGLARIGTGKTLAQVTRALGLIHDHSRIRTLSYFLFGYPGIPLGEEWKSFRFVRRQMRRADPRAEVFLTPLRMYPHTPIARQLGAQADSLVTRIIHTFSDVHLLLFAVQSFRQLAAAMREKRTRRGKRTDGQLDAPDEKRENRPQ